MLSKLNRWLAFVIGDLLVWVVLLIVGGKLIAVANCDGIRVRVYLVHHLFQKIRVGTTLGRNILVVDLHNQRENLCNVAHELVHVRQIANDGVWFYIRYLIGSLFTEWSKRPYEREAIEAYRTCWRTGHLGCANLRRALGDFVG